MSEHRLRLQVGPRQLEQLSVRDFLWRPRGDMSSFASSLSPRLEELGNVPPLHIDFVRLAVLAFLADRSVPRDRGKGMRWDRELHLSVPVSAPDLWAAEANELAYLLHVLSGDRWSIRFEVARAPRKGKITAVEPTSVVCLFSGGADSLAGALEARAATNSPPVLVSHWDNNLTSASQTAMLRKLAELWEEPLDHHRLQIQRRKDQVGSGLPFPDEPSRRTRSLLFLSLGLAVAAARDAELWMSENGFTSVNPPLSPERRGSLTTRTAHPGILDTLVDVLRRLGLKADLHNPLESMTKGEVLARAAAQIPDAGHTFSMTHSCGKTPWFKGFSQSAQCGLCYGCLVRRGSFLASGLDDQTPYIEKVLRGDPRRELYATPTRRKTVDAARYRLRRGYSVKDLLPLALPSRMPIQDVLDLVNRGVEELRPVVDDIP